MTNKEHLTSVGTFDNSLFKRMIAFMGDSNKDELIATAEANASFTPTMESTYVRTCVNGVSLGIELYDAGTYEIVLGGTVIDRGAQGDGFSNELDFETNLENAVKTVVTGWLAGLDK